MPIVPDDKNWTWVLDEVCPECGYDAATVDLSRMPELVGANADAWTAVLARPDVARRPSDDRWSALEYGCHVRDVFALFVERLELMLDTDAPRFENWNQDDTAIAQRYHLQDPAKVSRELVAAAERNAACWTRVGDDQWDRTGERSDGALFTVDSFARYFLHDPVHHLHDVNGSSG
ncbi:MAG: DinB family protein [Ilumatobacteraceae bacterium]